jgi:hypothetical protein
MGAGIQRTNVITLPPPAPPDKAGTGGVPDEGGAAGGARASSLSLPDQTLDQYVITSSRCGHALQLELWYIAVAAPMVSIPSVSHFPYE